MIERDANIPPLEELCAELDQARAAAERALRGGRCDQVGRAGASRTDIATAPNAAAHA
jgi:hypothetical protein